MQQVPLWLWSLSATVVLVGLWLGRSPRYEKTVQRLPLSVCLLLVLGALIGVCLLITVQFGGLVVQVLLDH